MRSELGIPIIISRTPSPSRLGDVGDLQRIQNHSTRTSRSPPRRVVRNRSSERRIEAFETVEIADRLAELERRLEEARTMTSLRRRCRAALKRETPDSMFSSASYCSKIETL